MGVTVNFANSKSVLFFVGMMAFSFLLFMVLKIIDFIAFSFRVRDGSGNPFWAFRPKD
jgi:uncharacterized membrane protein YdbT with pleckstrin-like domain